MAGLAILFLTVASSPEADPLSILAQARHLEEACRDLDGARALYRKLSDGGGVPPEIRSRALLELAILEEARGNLRSSVDLLERLLRQFPGLEDARRGETILLGIRKACGPRAIEDWHDLLASNPVLREEAVGLAMDLAQEEDVLCRASEEKLRAMGTIVLPVLREVARMAGEPLRTRASRIAAEAGDLSFLPGFIRNAASLERFVEFIIHGPPEQRGRVAAVLADSLMEEEYLGYRDYLLLAAGDPKAFAERLDRVEEIQPPLGAFRRRILSRLLQDSPEVASILLDRMQGGVVRPEDLLAFVEHGGKAATPEAVAGLFRKVQEAAAREAVLKLLVSRRSFDTIAAIAAEPYPEGWGRFLSVCSHAAGDSAPRRGMVPVYVAMASSHPESWAAAAGNVWYLASTDPELVPVLEKLLRARPKPADGGGKEPASPKSIAGEKEPERLDFRTAGGDLEPPFLALLEAVIAWDDPILQAEACRVLWEEGVLVRRPELHDRVSVLLASEDERLRLLVRGILLDHGPWLESPEDGSRYRDEIFPKVAERLLDDFRRFLADSEGKEGAGRRPPVSSSHRVIRPVSRTASRRRPGGSYPVSSDEAPWVLPGVLRLFEKEGGPAFLDAFTGAGRVMPEDLAVKFLAPIRKGPARAAALRRLLRLAGPTSATPEAKTIREILLTALSDEPLDIRLKLDIARGIEEAPVEVLKSQFLRIEDEELVKSFFGRPPGLAGLSRWLTRLTPENRIACLRVGLESPNVQLRLFALKGLRGELPRKEYSQVRVSLLADADPSVRITVVKEIAEDPDRDPGENTAIVQLLGDEDPSVRLAAIGASQASDAQAACAALRAIVQSDPNAGNRSAALKALEKINALEERKDRVRRWVGAEALGEIRARTARGAPAREDSGGVESRPVRID